MLGAWALGQEPLGGFGGATGYVLRGEAGVFALAGQDAHLSASITFTAEAGDYVITGQDAGLTHGYVLDAEHGSFSLAGQDAGGLYGYVLAAARGQFTVTGQSANFVVNRVLVAATGLFEVSGQDSGFERTFGPTGIKHLHRMGNPIGSRSISLAPIKARHGYLRASAR